MAEEKEEKKITVKLPKLNVWMVSTLILIIAIGFLLYRGTSITGKMVGELSKEEAAQKTINYINNNLVQPGTSASLVSVEEFNGLYKVITSYQGQQIPVYITKDGNYLFISQPLNTLEELPKQSQQQQTKMSCEDVPKKDEPLLEAFVVSKCPFGLQMQRILVEIVEKIPSLAKNIKVRYIGSIQNGNITSMHGDAEAQENLRQICIREEQPDKFWDYIACHIKKGDVENCLNGINKEKLNNCMKDANKGLKYAKEDFDLQDKYGVTGSPTLILNGERVRESDFGGRTAQAVKTLLCCGFEGKPEFCDQNLTTQQAATGFSETYSGSSGSGQC